MALVRAAGEPSQVEVEAAARVERALRALRPDADEIEHGFEDLRSGLRQLQRALRDVLGHRVDRPLSLRHLQLLLDASLRVLSTAAVGLLGVLALATRDGTAHGDAAVAAATAAAAPVEGIVELVRRRLRCAAPGTAAAGRARRPHLPGRRLRPRRRARRRPGPARVAVRGGAAGERARGPLVAAGGLDRQARLRGQRPAGAGGARRGDAGGPRRRPGRPGRRHRRGPRGARVARPLPHPATRGALTLSNVPRDRRGSSPRGDHVGRSRCAGPAAYRSVDRAAGVHGTLG